MQRKIRSKVIFAILWSFGQKFFNQALSLAVFLILARLLIPEDFGAVAIASILISVLALFVQQGFSTAIIRHPDPEDGHLNAAFWLNLLAGTLFAVIGFLAAGLIARFYGSEDLLLVVRLLSLNLIIISLTEVQYALLIKRFQFKKLAIRSIISTTVGGAIGVGMALGGFGVFSLVAQHLSERFVSLLILWGSTGWLPGLSMSKRHVKDLWGFGVRMLGINILSNVRGKVDVLIISIFFGTAVVGYYAIAQKPIKMVTGTFIKVISRVSLPAFATVQNDPDRMAKGVCLAFKMVTLLVLPIVVSLMFFAEVFILVLVGESWIPSAGMMKALAFWLLAQGWLVFFAQAIVAKGKPGVVAAATAILVTSTSLAMLLAVPMGVLAVIIANVATTLALAIGFIVKTKNIVGVTYSALFLAVRGPLTGSLAFAGICLLLGIFLDGKVHALLGLILGGGGYVAVLGCFERDMMQRGIELVRARFWIKKAETENGMIDGLSAVETDHEKK